MSYEKTRNITIVLVIAVTAVSLALIAGFIKRNYEQVLANSQQQITLTAATVAVGRPTYTREAMFYKKLPNNVTECNICFRNCVISEGARGYCQNKENKEGVLYNIVHGRPSAVHVDPIEKEPQHHVLPGSQILCIGTAGCNFRCNHCQNWHLSQNPIEKLSFYDFPPEKVVQFALDNSVPTISFTYNDPISTFEYVYDVAKLAQSKGLNFIWHSNGAINPEPLKKLLQYTDAVTIDIKGFSERAYDNADAELEPVLEALKIMREKGVWIEIVYLVIPTINDDLNEIRAMCNWVVENLGSHVPVHFSRFFPAFRLRHLPPTPVSTLERAHRVAKEAGLDFVSVGNVPGHKYNSTFCPNCEERIIHRVHFSVVSNDIVNGKCKHCNHNIPGIWQ